MSDRLLNRRALYPLLGVAAAVCVLVCGLLAAKGGKGLWYLCGVWLLFLCFGYWRACLAVLPAAAVLCAVLAGITWGISHDTVQTLAAVNRILAVCIAVIPGLAMAPIALVRCLTKLRLPRLLTLAMMITLSFFPLLSAEVRQVREAMKTRGAGSLLTPTIFYRAFLIPLMMRLLNISDTLALSVETRGFSTDRNDCSVYRTQALRPADALFVLLLLAGSMWVIL